jgi:hypothetical protein
MQKSKCKVQSEGEESIAGILCAVNSYTGNGKIEELHGFDFCTLHFDVCILSHR